jgi:excisionase family DNA binding protein
MEKLFLRPAEAGELIGFSRAAIYHLIHSEELPACKIGKSIRINRAALEQWAANKALELSKPTGRHRRTVNGAAQDSKGMPAQSKRPKPTSAKSKGGKR